MNGHRMVGMAGAILVVSILLLASGGYAKIPEPDNIIYGLAREDTVHMSLWVDGEELAVYTMGENPNADDYYILRVPMDSIDPQNPGTARPGDVAQIYINGETAPAATVLIGERGTVTLLHLATDADNDSVPDILDKCPDTPEGEPVDEDGCSTSQLVDSDGDGVPDYIDVCPGYDDIPDANNNGIPDCLDDADTDGDGFTDREEVLCGSDVIDPLSVCARPMPWIYLLLGD